MTTRAYLDANASDVLRPQAREAVIEALALTGNASSVHTAGRAARRCVEDARVAVAELVGARGEDVVFTSGATEANAIVFAQDWDAIFVSRIEHAAVLEPAQAAAKRAARDVGQEDGQDDALLRWLSVSGTGVIDVDAATSAMRAWRDVHPDARALLSVQAANNETGVLQPLDALAQAARDLHIAVHCDAAQLPGRMAFDVAALGLTYTALSAHKMGGPHGVGALIDRASQPLMALTPGGGQERRRRGGTHNTAAIAGFGAAAKAVLADVREDRLSERLRAGRDKLEAGLCEALPGTYIIGEAAPRLPNTTLAALPGASAETLIIKLDLAGIDVSAGAACSSGKVGASHVLQAMGLDAEIAAGAVRFSIGWATCKADIERAATAWARLGGSAASSFRSPPAPLPSTTASPARAPFARAS